MNYQTIELSLSNSVATVTLNRPQVLNAFSDLTISELDNCVSTVGERDDIRLILLASRGKCFSAGADLAWMKRMAQSSYQENLADAHRLAAMLHTVYSCRKPVVARIQGDAFGGGVGLIAAADIAIAINSARFSLSEVTLGLIPATISPYVIRAISARAARRYFTTGERFGAAEAHRIGLLHEVAPAERLDARVQSIVSAILKNGPDAVAKSKQLIQDIEGRSLSQELLAETAERIAQVRASEEGREGVRAFLEKRAPSWRQDEPFAGLKESRPSSEPS
jgi:methylglutaconyl-CoA hydratase